MPAYYKSKKGFPATLQQSIQQFTAASLKRDGINVDVSVTVTTDLGTATVTFSGSDSAAVKRAGDYVSVLPAFMNSNYAGLGLNGAKACQAATGCWDPYPGVSPWAFYLPLGLPMVNQKALMLLNYPPSDALCSADYLSNFTMARWTSVLQTVGITDPVLYETIVDVHPIAAPGSGQSTCIAKTTQYFYNSGQANYDQAMLNLLLAPPGRSPGPTVPLQVAGSDAFVVWSAITGKTLNPGDVGTFTSPGQAPIPWIATNHPDVTSYQRCPGDPAPAPGPQPPTCSSTGGSSNYSDNQLVEDELLDLQAACVLKTLAGTPSTSPEDALTACKKIWCTEDNGICRKQDVCVQARMDYNYNSVGHCNCQEAAQNFCQANSYNACPSTISVTSCAPYNSVCKGNKQSYSTCKSLTAN
jgi:hypothetical protein